MRTIYLFIKKYLRMFIIVLLKYHFNKIIVLELSIGLPILKVAMIKYFFKVWFN